MKNLIAKIYYKFFTKNKGLLKEEPDERDYIFGAIKKRKVLREDGQWTAFLPKGELQKNPLETMSCTSQSILNCVEIINKIQYNEDKNYSDRFLAKCSNTTKRGNSVRKVLETLRKYYGTVGEKQWSGANFKSWENYYKAIQKDILDMGQLWIKRYNLEYESVKDNKSELTDALKYSPLCAAGFAWYNKNGLYQSYGRANHYFVIVGYKQNEYWLAFDSYSPFLKKLDWNYKFSYVKTLFLEKNKIGYNQEVINKLKKRGYKYIQRPEANGEFYELTDQGLKYLTSEQARDLGIKTLSTNKQLIGINEEYYNSLIK